MYCIKICIRKKTASLALSAVFPHWYTIREPAYSYRFPFILCALLVILLLHKAIAIPIAIHTVMVQLLRIYVKQSCTIELAKPCLVVLPIHSKAFSSTLCLFHALYEPFKSFLCLSVNVDKVCIQSPACKKIGVCNPAVLLQMLQMLLPHVPIGCSSSADQSSTG